MRSRKRSPRPAPISNPDAGPSRELAGARLAGARHVRAVFTTRGTSPRDGASARAARTFSTWETTSAMRPVAVAANRAHLPRRAMGARPVFLQQVHGTEVLDDRRPPAPDGATADAAVMAAPGLACTVMVADCLAVLLTDAQGRAVAAAHAGWRGPGGRRAGAQVLKRFKALASVAGICRSSYQ
jgi:copper oxidase (laccase) domain-containing protein